MAAPMDTLRVLELYSGIGGMHFALKGSGLPYNVVTAMDVNTNANKVYKHNFPDVAINDSAIESMSQKQFDKLEVDMILMSPPCQPFTRVGKQQDLNDPRTKSFLHVLQLLDQASRCPRYILVENVKGFEVSESHDRLVHTLKQRDYDFQEFLLTPLQFCIPNSRLRYFLIAKLKPANMAFQTTDGIMEEIPLFAREWLIHQQATQSGVKVKGQTQEWKCDCGGFTKNEANHYKVTKSNEINPMNQLTDTCENSSQEPDTKRLKLNEPCKHRERSACDHNDSGTKYKEDTAAFAEDKTTNDNKTIESKCLEDKGEHSVSETESKGLTVAHSVTPISIKTKSESCLKTGNASHSDDPSNKLHICVPDGSDLAYDCLENYGKNLRQSSEEDGASDCVCARVGQFLEPEWWDRERYRDYWLKEKEFKRFVIMDVINPCSRKTCCFTKRYGHYIEGAGSVVQMTRDIQVLEHASRLKAEAVSCQNRDQWGEKEYGLLRELGLRYFTPREIANILCFPPSFSFPADLTNRQKYMLLGNSLNVSMVTVLIKILVAGDSTVC